MKYKVIQNLAICSVLLSACASAPAPAAAPAAAPKAAEPTVVHVKLNEFKIELDRSSFPAGEVKFEIQNTGVISHEMIIELPESMDVALEADGKQAEAEAIDPGKSATLTWKLDKPGVYHLSCHNSVNNVDHFKVGMMTPITVTVS